MQLIITVRLFKRHFTVSFINEENVFLPVKARKDLGLQHECVVEIQEDHISLADRSFSNDRLLKFTANSLFLQPFLKECSIFEIYRKNVLKNLSQLSDNSETVFLKLILKPPDKEVIDYGWNYRLLHLLWTRIEIENAFAWLSTLGGAYSALGDYFENFAEEAGRISLRQYRLSKLLGDDSLCARSRLYSALAYSQKRNLKMARRIVRQVAAFARDTNDVRLNRMCQGVWAKLKYLRQLKKNGCNNSHVNGATCVASVTEVKV